MNRQYVTDSYTGGYLLTETETCDYCGCEIRDGEASEIPYNRYYSFTACPACAAKEIEDSKIEEEEN